MAQDRGPNHPRRRLRCGCRYQFVGVIAVAAFSAVVTFGIAKLVAATVGLRATEQEEAEGLDISIHEERGYVLDAR